jgi:hypothetical protein
MKCYWFLVIVIICLALGVGIDALMIHSKSASNVSLYDLYTKTPSELVRQITGLDKVTENVLVTISDKLPDSKAKMEFLDVITNWNLEYPESVLISVDITNNSDGSYNYTMKFYNAQ